MDNTTEDIFLPLVERITEMLNNSKRKKWDFTLEAGRGQTYAHGKPTLYGHSTYERSSVLAGREQRVFVEQWDNIDEARKAMAEVKKRVTKCKQKFKYNDLYEGGGSTHIPIEQIVSHLPDDTNY